MKSALAEKPLVKPSTANPVKRTRKPAELGTWLSYEERRLLVSDRPITFEEWVDRGGRDLYELVNGSLVEMKAAELDHERLQVWLLTLLAVYVNAKGLGEVLGSRTAVKITDFGGRLPDIVFVRKDRRTIMQRKGIYEEPDLIIEIRSPGDRPSDVNALEAEYRTIGVHELWFIDPKRRRVRVLNRTNGGYADREVTTGTLESRMVDDFSIDVEWLWSDDRPEVADLVKQILKEVSIHGVRERASGETRDQILGG